MEIIETKKVEDCFDGSLIRELLLGEIIELPFIEHLGKMGQLQYFPNFPRPFFKVNCDGVLVKGIKGNSSMQVIIFDKERMAKLTQHIQAFHYE